MSASLRLTLPIVIVSLLLVATACGDSASGDSTPTPSPTAQATSTSASPATATATTPGPDAIAFISYRSGKSEVWVVNPDGTGMRQLTSSGGQKPAVYWSPDGSQVGFSHGGQSQPTYWAMNPDGTGLRETDLATIQGWFEARLAAAGGTYQLDKETARRVVDKAGKVVLSLASNEDASGLPQWSPDGKSLVVALARGAFAGLSDAELEAIRNDPKRGAAQTKGKFEIWLVDPATKAYTQLSRNTFDDVEPSWSPDGKRIAFSSDRDGDGLLELWVMNADGTDERQITPKGEVPVDCSPLPGCPGDIRPLWSPR